MHVFILESMVACALVSFGQQLAWKEGVPLERLWTETSFLHNLLKDEFITRQGLNNVQNLWIVINVMASRGILQVENDKIRVNIFVYFKF